VEIRGILRGVLGVLKSPKIWLAVGATTDHHPGIYKFMKQQTN